MYGTCFPVTYIEEYITFKLLWHVIHIVPKLYRCSSYREEFVTLHMRYSSIGSGGGKAVIKENPDEVEYAGSDSPLTESEHSAFPDLESLPSLAG